MTRLKLYLEYQGTRYSGWQIQKNARTVQGEICEAIRKVTGLAGFEFHGAGRTDAGVHALRQVAHLELTTSPESEDLRRRVNEQRSEERRVGKECRCRWSRVQCERKWCTMSG